MEKLTRRLIWLGAVVIAVLILLANMVNYRAAREQIINEFVKNQQLLAGIASNDLEEFAKNIYMEMNSLTVNPIVTKFDQKRLEEHLSIIQNRYRYRGAIQSFLLFDNKKNVKIVYPQNLKYENKKLSELANDKEFTRLYGPAHLEIMKISTGHRNMIMDVPFYRYNTNLVASEAGCIRVVIDFTKLADFFLSSINLQSSSYAFIIDEFGNLFLHSSKPELENQNVKDLQSQSDYPRFKKTIDQMISGSRGTSWHKYPLISSNNIKYQEVIIYQPLDMQIARWSMGISTPYYAIVKKSRTLFLHNVLSALLLVLLVFLSTILISKNERRFINVLQNRNRRLQSFNTLMRIINEHLTLEKILQKALSELKEIVGTEKSAVYIWNEEAGKLMLKAQIGLTEDFLEKFQEITLDKDDLLYKVLSEKKYKIISDTYGQKSLLTDQAQNYQIRSLMLVPLESKQRAIGILVAASSKINFFGHATEEFLLAMGSQLGVAIEHAELFNNVQEKSRLLEIKNSELDSFVYAVTHDLKAPIASIHGFASLLLESADNTMSDKQRDFLTRIINNTEHMGLMIQDLLQFSRVGRVQEKYEELSVYQLIKTVKNQFKSQIENGNIHLKIQDNLPKVYYPKVHLFQIFHNLISNSIKFAGDHVSPPEIKIGYYLDSSTSENVFFVKDNGIGIDPQYHDEIFKVFSRLKEIEVEGSGLGLAIVKKIITFNGGRIWVESEWKNGAAFYFTIPSRSAQNELFA